MTPGGRGRANAGWGCTIWSCARGGRITWPLRRTATPAAGADRPGGGGSFAAPRGRIAATGRLWLTLPSPRSLYSGRRSFTTATGDEHYDAASALIKSMRGSDPDAAVYWLARMLEAGEDPRFIARRVAICAAEDVGNADPMALVVANAAAQVTLLVGMPECQLPLSQAVTYIARRPSRTLRRWPSGRPARTCGRGERSRSRGICAIRTTTGRKRLGHGKGMNTPTTTRADLCSRIIWVSIRLTTPRPTGATKQRSPRTWQRSEAGRPAKRRSNTEVIETTQSTKGTSE